MVADLVAAETGTWLREHFTETLADMKYLLDDLFLVPLGVLLSGGLDSSAVASYIHRAGSRLKAYSIGLPEVNEFAYSRAVVDGDWIFVSGTTGFDYATMRIDEDPLAQCHQCFRNIAAALGQPVNTVKSHIFRARDAIAVLEEASAIAVAEGDMLAEWGASSGRAVGAGEVATVLKKEIGGVPRLEKFPD